MSLGPIPDFPFPPSGTAGLIGALIGAGAGSLGTVYAQHRQANLDYTRDRRNLRDARGQRLREAYSPILKLTDSIRISGAQLSAIIESGAGPGSDIAVEGHAMLTAIVEAKEQFKAAAIAIRLEPGSQDVIDSISRMTRKLDASLRMCAKLLRGEDARGDAKRSLDSIRIAAKDTETLLLRKIAETQQPIK